MDTPRNPPLFDEKKEIEDKEIEKVIEPLVRWRAREIGRRLLHPLADEPSIASAEPVHIVKRIFDKLRNGVIE